MLFKPLSQILSEKVWRKTDFSLSSCLVVEGVKLLMEEKTHLHIYSFHFASLFCSSDVITPRCLLRLSYGCYNNCLQDTAPLRVVTVLLQVSIPLFFLFLLCFLFSSSPFIVFFLFLHLYSFFISFSYHLLFKLYYVHPKNL